jgi:PAS domain S-box-containing protein
MTRAAKLIRRWKIFMVIDRGGHNMRRMAGGKWAENLREAEELFRTTVENLPINLVVYDRDYRILCINPMLAATCAKLSGRKPDELVGLRGPDLWPKVIWDPLFQHTEHAVATRERHTYELATRLPGCAPVVREWTVVPLIGANNEVDRVVAMSIDVTAQRQMVEELRAADQRKSDFIAILSHELRNPLGPILNGVRILREGAREAAAVERVLSMIERNALQLARMVDDLLDASRISEGKLSLHIQPADLVEIVRDSVDTAMPAISAAGHTLEVDLPEEPVIVQCDPERISQVLGNLLLNAAKYTPSGGRIEVRLKRSPTGQSACVFVKDNGIGIPAEMLPKLFGMFVQAGPSGRKGGLGIGLALSRRLVELHGGSITVKSLGSGAGAEFIVDLPVGGQLRVAA